MQQISQKYKKDAIIWNKLTLREKNSVSKIIGLRESDRDSKYYDIHPSLKTKRFHDFLSQLKIKNAEHLKYYLMNKERYRKTTEKLMLRSLTR